MFRCLWLLRPVGEYLLTLLIFIVHRKSYVSINAEITSAFKRHPPRIAAASGLLPSPESQACMLQRMMVLQRQLVLVRKN
jgi:hypothetical protein